MKNLLIKIILGLAVISLFTSCKTTPPQVIYKTKDSLITKETIVIKDSIIHVPGDTIRFQIPCDNDTVFVIKSKTSHSLVQVKNGLISVQNNCDEKDLIITKLQDKLHHYEAQSNDSLKTEKIFVKKIPGIYKFTFWGFWVVAALASTLFLINKNLWFAVIAALAGLIKSFKKVKK